jgi:hypothetical protein
MDLLLYGLHELPSGQPICIDLKDGVFGYSNKQPANQKMARR